MFNKIKVSYLVLIIFFCSFALPAISWAQLSSTNFQLDVFGVGEGSGTGTSTNFTTEASIGPTFTYDTTVDTDGDGIPDATETANGSNPNDANDPTANGSSDDDGDGITNAVEFLIGGNATSTTVTQDTDGDGIADAREVANGTDHTDGDDPVSGGTGDTDGDGLPNGAESVLCSVYPSLADCTNPSLTSDSDGDGVTDIDEYNAGSDPTDADDPTVQSSGGGGGGGGGSSSPSDETAELEVDETEDDVIEGDTPVAFTVPTTPGVGVSDTETPATDSGDSGSQEVGVGSIESDDPAPTRDSNSSVPVIDDTVGGFNESDLVTEERRIVYQDTGDYFTYTEQFEDGHGITVGVPSGSIRDVDGKSIELGKEVTIIVQLQLLALTQVPQKILDAAVQGSRLFGITVVDQLGNIYTQFDPPLEIAIELPDDMVVSNDTRLYYFDEDQFSWLRVPGATVGSLIEFTTTHLTTFGLWGSPEDLSILATAHAENNDSETNDLEKNNFDSKDSQGIGWWWIVVLTILCLFLITKRRKQK